MYWLDYLDDAFNFGGSKKYWEGTQRIEEIAAQRIK